MYDAKKNIKKYDAEMPLISVIMPSYNSAETINRAIVSCMQQSYPNVEVIVVDNGSSDGTAEYARKIAGCYSFELPDGTESCRIKVIEQENLGVSAARNAGIRAAKGEWLLSLDSDDYYETDTAMKLYAAVRGSMKRDIVGRETVGVPAEDGENNAARQADTVASDKGSTNGETAIREQDIIADLAVCGMRKVYEDDISRNEEFEPCGFQGTLHEFCEEAFTELYDLHLISTHSNKLYNRKLMTANDIYYNEELAVNEDIDFVLRYLAVCRRICVIPDIFLNYVQHKTGQSLINTFQPHGLKGALIVLASCDRMFDAAESSDAIRTRMDSRLFVHICSFAGLMYYRSNYDRTKRLSELRLLCENRDFETLLARMKPQSIKDRAACLMLRYKLIGLYDAVSSFVYRHAD